MSRKLSNTNSAVVMQEIKQKLDQFKRLTTIHQRHIQTHRHISAQPVGSTEPSRRSAKSHHDRTLLFVDLTTWVKSLSCRRQTRATRYLTPTVLYTKVDGRPPLPVYHIERPPKMTTFALVSVAGRDVIIRCAEGRWLSLNLQLRQSSRAKYPYLWRY